MAKCLPVLCQVRHVKTRDQSGSHPSVFHVLLFSFANEWYPSPHPQNPQTGVPCTLAVEHEFGGGGLSVWRREWSNEWFPEKKCDQEEIQHFSATNKIDDRGPLEADSDVTMMISAHHNDATTRFRI